MRSARLKELGEIITGNTPKTSEIQNYESDDICFVKPSDIDDKSISKLKNSEYYISEYARKSARIAPKHSILVTCIGTIGKIAILENECAFNQQINAIIPDEKQVYPLYLAYNMFFQKKYLQQKANAPVVPIINKTDFGDFKIKLHNLIEQQKIIDVLDKIENLIDNRQQQLNLLNELIESRFIEMFGDPVTNPMGWTNDSMGKYMTVLTDFSANGSYEYLDSNVIMYDEPNYALMVRTTDLENNDFEHNVKYIDENAYNILSKSKIFGNEMIMNKIGSAGKIYLMPCLNRPVSLGRNAFLFRFNDNINIVFLYNFLMTEYGNKEIMKHVRGAVTKTITKEAVRAIQIIVPPIELQNKFAAFVEQVEKTKSTIKKSLEELNLLKDSLMQKYFG